MLTNNAEKKPKALAGANQRFWSLAIDRGYDAERMAEVLDYSYSTICKIKEGWRPVNKNVAQRVRKKLGINEDWLLYNKGVKEAEKNKEVSPKLVTNEDIDVKDLLKMYMDMSDRLTAVEGRAAARFKINMPAYDSPKINVDNPSQAELITLLNLSIQRIYKLENLLEIAINKNKNS